jgi:hypothetical protein
MSEDKDSPGAAMKEPVLTIKPLKYLYQVLFILSAIANLVFAVINYQQKTRLSELEIEKRTAENRVLAAEHRPSFSIFRLIYEINTFDKFVRSGDQPPFLDGNRTYRILDNDVYREAKSDLDAIQKRNRVNSRLTFLAIANTHDVTAYAVTAASAEGTKYRLGDLEGHSAILIPLVYEKNDRTTKSIKIGTDDLSKIAYRDESADKEAGRELAVPPPANLTWTPLLNDSVVGRASAAQADDGRLNDLIPKDNDK